MERVKSPALSWDAINAPDCSEYETKQTLAQELALITRLVDMGATHAQAQLELVRRRGVGRVL